jgi:tRNA A37 methylthiotransferase MiaB
MPRVEPAAVKARARRLREASARRREAWLQGMVGTVQRVLIERDGKGHAENFAPVRVEEPRHSRESGNPASSLAAGQEEKKRDPRFRGGDGDVLDVLITSATADTLVGTPA